MLTDIFQPPIRVQYYLDHIFYQREYVLWGPYLRLSTPRGPSFGLVSGLAKDLGMQDSKTLPFGRRVSPTLYILRQPKAI
jgi:hypothetical protein